MPRGPQGSGPIQEDERSGSDNVEGPYVHAEDPLGLETARPSWSWSALLFHFIQQYLMNIWAVKTAGWISSRLVLSRVSAAKGLESKGAEIIWQHTVSSRSNNEESETRMLQAWKRMLQSSSFSSPRCLSVCL